jgi:Caspase domain
MRSILIALACIALDGFAEPQRRALLIGIDDYTASTLARPRQGAAPIDRGWPDLKGAANDVEILRQMLVHVYGLSSTDIITLKNQQATRAAILRAIEQHLAAPAAKGDIVFLYFAGHGAQVPNSASDEPDKHDEAIVPADSRYGTPDIRDKELRRFFNRILDRGAQLTILVDHCHSGSSFRGLPTGARPRGIGPAPAIVDASPYGRRPEERGALVLTSAQDLDPAWEIRGEDGQMHGAFTWAWIRAMRDAEPGEPAQETFLRAQARLRAEAPDQSPVLLGDTAARMRPFLRARIDRPNNQIVVGVERVRTDRSIVLQGGWANGLFVGSELAPRGGGSRLRVTEILGLTRSIARSVDGRPPSPAIRAGALLEITGWAAPPGRPMRVWMPRTAMDARAIAQFAQRIKASTKARWIADPSEETPTHVLRPRGNGWELLARAGSSTQLNTQSAVIAAVARLPRTASFFAQFPASAKLVEDLVEAIQPVDDPKNADYILTGRFHTQRLEYAWLRPHVGAGAMPRRTAWSEAVLVLREHAVKLRRIHAWQVLEPPPHTRAPYRLTLRDNATKAVARGPLLRGAKNYTVILRATQKPPAHLTPRHYYVFVIDSHGESHLLFPRSGSVENRFPIRDPAPMEIPIEASAFDVTPPYGRDTFILLSTEAPIPLPSILSWGGVRAPAGLTQSRWSIERVLFESVPAQRR